MPRRVIASHADATYLVRRGQIWQFRRAVPKELVRLDPRGVDSAPDRHSEHAPTRPARNQRAAGISLSDYGAVHGVTTQRDIVDVNDDDITYPRGLLSIANLK